MNQQKLNAVVREVVEILKQFSPGEAKAILRAAELMASVGVSAREGGE